MLAATRKHKLKFDWLIYPEPESYRGTMPTIRAATSSQASFIAPKVETAQTMHIILMVTDQGSPPLTRYQRTIVTVSPKSPAQ